MIHFAAIDGDPTALALIAIVGAVITALFKLLGDNTKAQGQLSKALGKLTDETAKGNREAKERNGHLGEQNLQITQMIGTMTAQIQKAADRNFDAITNIKEQHVDRQIVKSETVEHKEDK